VPTPSLKLVVVDGEKRGAAFDLTSPVAIGSNRSSDLHLADPAVSWNHARVWLEGASVMVEDFGSAHGTIVNGRPVRRAVLQAGDDLLIGGTHLALTDRDLAVPGAAVAVDQNVAELEELRQSLATKEEEAASLRDNVAASAQELEKVRSEAKKATGKLERSEARLEAALEAQREVEKTKKTLGETQAALETTRKEKKTLAREAAKLKDLQAKVGERDTEKKKLGSELGSLQDELTKVKTAVEEESKSRRAAEKKLEKTEAALRRAEEEATAWQTKEKDSGKAYRALQTTLNELQQQLARRQEELAASEKSLRSLEGELQRSQQAEKERAARDAQAHETAVAESEAVRAEVSAATEQLQDREENLAAVRLEVARLQKVLGERDEAVARLEVEKGDVARAQSEASARAEVLETEWTQARQAADGLRVANSNLAEASVKAREQTLETHAELRRENESYQLKLQALAERLERDQELRQGDRQELNGSRERVRELEDSLAKLRLDNESHQLKLQALEERLAREQELRRRGDEEVTRGRERLREAGEQLETTRGERDEARREHSGALSDGETLGRQLDEAKEVRRSLEAELAEVRQQFEAALQKNRDLETRSLRGETRVAGLQAEQETWRSERAELVAHKGRLEVEGLDLQKRLLERESAAAGALERADVLAKSLEETRRRLADVEGERDALSKRLDDELGALTAGRDGLQVRLEEVEARLRADTERLLGELSAQTELANERGEAVRRAEETVAENAAHARAEIARLRGLGIALEDDLVGVRAELEDLKKRHGREVQELEALRAEHRQALTELELLRSYTEELRGKTRDKERQLLDYKGRLRHLAGSPNGRQGPEAAEAGDGSEESTEPSSPDEERLS